MSLGVVEVHVTYTKCPPLDITVIIIIIIINFFFGDQNFFCGDHFIILKVAKRRLFQKVSLECCFRCAGVCLFVGLKIKVHLRMLHGVVAVPFRNTLSLKPEII